MTESAGGATSPSAVSTPALLVDAITALAEASSTSELLPAAATGAVQVADMSRAIVIVADRRGATDRATARDRQGQLDAPLLADVRTSIGRRGVVDLLMAADHAIWKSADDLVVLHEPWLDRHDVRGVLGIPVSIRTGAAMLVLTTTSITPPGDDTVAAVEQLARVLGSLLDASTRFDREQRARRTAELLVRHLDEIAASGDLRGVLRSAVDGLARLTDDEVVAAATFVDGEVTQIEVAGDQRRAATILRTLEASEPDRHLVVPDLGDPEWKALANLDIGRLLAVRLRHGDAAQGWMMTGASSRRRHTRQVHDAAEILGRQTSMALVTAARLRAERDALLRLEELDRLKTEFVSSLSHELRTPLTALVGYSELLAEWSPDDPQFAFAHDMRREAALLETRIGNLLDSSRLEAGMLRLNPRPLDAVGLVREAAEASMHSHPGRTVVVGSDRDRLPVVADAERLRQVLGNLLDNALRYSPDGTDVSVTVAAAPGRPGIVIHVDDQGPGVPEDHRDAIFERFARLGHTEAKAGTGIGLYLVKSLVEAHQGSVTVGESPSGGARFSVWLPPEAP